MCRGQNDISRKLDPICAGLVNRQFAPFFSLGVCSFCKEGERLPMPKSIVLGLAFHLVCKSIVTITNLEVPTEGVSDCNLHSPLNVAFEISRTRPAFE